MSYLVESLPHIGKTSVIVHTAKKPLLTSLGMSALVLTGELGETVNILLPQEVDSDGSHAFVQLASQTFALRLNNKKENFVEYIKTNKSRNVLMSVPEGKWTKSDLVRLRPFTLNCLTCDFPIINDENCLMLHEMPSEFWMELMDYWHCHKPHDHGNLGRSSEYCAKQNSLNPTTYEVLVGGSFFLANSSTFKGRVTCDQEILSCSKCNSVLGKKKKDQTYCVHKYNLMLISNQGEKRDYFSPQNDVVMTLMNHVNANSARFVLLKCDCIKILVWIFAIGIHVTLPNGEVLNNCMKLLYYEGEISELGLKQNIDSIEMDFRPMMEFQATLKNTNKILPKTVMTMDKWRVSYIPILS